jgi:serine/threonine protein kinase
VAKLDHPNIIKIHDISESQGLHFFSMEYVEGQTFEEVLSQKGFLSSNDAIRIISEVASAVDHAHRHGITHRDIKPSNIMISYQGAVKLMDFGVALSETAPRVTADGAIVGTPEYMSPEQASGEKATALCDIYALGIVLYELLTGTVPFEADTPLSVIKKIQTEDPPPPRSINPRIPIELENVILRMIAKDPVKRYQNCRQIVEDLAKFRAGTHVSAHAPKLSNISFSSQSIGIILAVLFVILILAGLTYVGKITGESSEPAWFPPPKTAQEPAIQIPPEPPVKTPPGEPPVPQPPVQEEVPEVADEPKLDRLEKKVQPPKVERNLESPITEAQADARRELQGLEIPYKKEEFINRVKQDDVNAASLFIAGGMSPETSDKDYRTALILTAMNGSISTLKILLDNNAKIDAEDSSGLTAIMHGARLGHSGIVKLLLERGATVNTRNKAGMTALMLAAQGGSPEVVEALLDYGADVSARNARGDTALIISASKGYSRIVKILLDRGADVNSKDTSGVTALMLAVQGGSPQVVEVLLEYGADVNAMDAFGGTALAWAEMRDQDEIALLLKEAGAKE